MAEKPKAEKPKGRKDKKTERTCPQPTKLKYANVARFAEVTFVIL